MSLIVFQNTGTLNTLSQNPLKNPHKLYTHSKHKSSSEHMRSGANLGAR